MKKAIITAVVVLAVLTGIGIFALGKMSHNIESKSNKKQPANIPAETRQLLDSDKETRTGQEVLDEIKNLGKGQQNDSGTSTEEQPSQRYEISRESYEKCGHDTGSYIIKYSDGSYEIVDSEDQTK